MSSMIFGSEGPLGPRLSYQCHLGHFFSRSMGLCVKQKHLDVSKIPITNFDGDCSIKKY